MRLLEFRRHLADPFHVDERRGGRAIRIVAPKLPPNGAADRSVVTARSTTADWPVVEGNGDRRNSSFSAAMRPSICCTVMPPRFLVISGG